MAQPDTKKRRERFFLDKMIRQLNWSPRSVEQGSEPPDFFITLEDRRCAVEITHMMQSEMLVGGSPIRAQEGADEGFVTALRDAYFSDPAPQQIQVSAILPLVVRSPAVRRPSRDEQREHMKDIKRMALARLRHLPKLKPGQDWKFRVQHLRGGATFHVFCFPPGMGPERLWEPINSHVGFVAGATQQLLQRKVEAKSRGLAKYRSGVDSAVLLIVADKRRASGFFELDPEAVVDPQGFDAVYFQDDDTKQVATRVMGVGEPSQGPA